MFHVFLRWEIAAVAEDAEILNAGIAEIAEGAV
jgi:hypothetical protein